MTLTRTKPMRQYRKDVLREQLALSADEIIRLRYRIEALEAALRFSWPAEWEPEPRKWWHRLMWWRK